MDVNLLAFPDASGPNYRTFVAKLLATARSTCGFGGDATVAENSFDNPDDRR